MRIPIKCHIYYNRYLKENMKFVPIIGVILLLLLFSSENNDINLTEDNTDDSLFEMLQIILEDFTNSFDFSDRIQLFTTFLLIITIWTGYKYWLIKIRVIRRNTKLVDNLIFAILLLVFSVHINFNSPLGEFFDLGYFLIVLYVVLAGSWFFAKVIDSFNLERDLYCWGLRIFGIILLIFGGLISMSFTIAIASSPNESIFNNIFWIIGLCIMALGAFSEYRSIRRHGVFVYMR
jgi:hypothetical protein